MKGEAVLARGGTSDFHKILQNLIIRRSRQESSLINIEAGITVNSDIVPLNCIAL